MINAYSNTWGEVITAQSFSDIDISNPIQYYDDIYSYDVHLVYSITADNGEMKEFPIHFKMFVLGTGNGYQVFDMERITKQEQQSETDDVASRITPSLYVGDQKIDAMCIDGNATTGYTFQDGESLRIESEQDIGAVYIKWKNGVKPYTLETNEGAKTLGTDGYLHELIKGSENLKTMEFTGLQDNTITEIEVYSKGSLPVDVQDWSAPYKESDILAFPTHADDDVLYMGALISEYIAKGKNIQLAFVTNSNSAANTTNADIRLHEMLDGMWKMGLRAYPIVGEFQDFGSRDIAHAKTLYNSEQIQKFQVSNIRRFRPDIVIGHDVNGEYGHGVHMLNTHLLKEAIHLANDETYHCEPYENYEIYAPKKTYLYLYDQHQITLDVHKKMEGLGGRSPFEVATSAYEKHVSQHKYDLAVEDHGVGDCRLFGLYHSLVGYDALSNDLFEGIE